MFLLSSRHPSTRQVFARLCAPQFSTTVPIRATKQLNIATPAEDEPRLPRYLRRQLAFEQPAAPAKAEVKTFRSKHFDPSKEHKSKTEMKLLEPHTLSARIKKLCDSHQMDTAVSMLKNSPLDAQNAPVWNTLIWEAMKAKRFKLGYELYIDMKRRGHSPTTRTFQTMFSGLTRIENWSSHAKQLANARSLYEAYQRYILAMKKTDPASSDLSIAPLAAYIKVLGNAGCFQDIFDVYYAMDTRGPLAPDQRIFTAIFQALAPKAEIGDQSVMYLKNAADAKLLWNQMLKASRKAPGFPVDSFIASAAIAALMRGGTSEQSLAFEITRDYFGLCSREHPTPPENIIPLEAPSLSAILRLCNYARRPDLCLDFIQQVKRRPEDMGGPSILDHGHMDEVIRAHLALSRENPKYDCGDQALRTIEWMLRQEILGQNGPRIRPTHSTYSLVMTACWRSGDWTSAARTFELMTGYHTHNFMDGAVAEFPRKDKRSPDRYIPLTPEIASSMIRAALNSGNRANMRQCLRIISHLGLDKIVGPRADDIGSNKAAKNRGFFISKLNSAIFGIVERVRTDKDSPEEAEKWNQLFARAKQLEDASIVGSTFIPKGGTE